MAVLTRIVAAVALVSILFADIAGASASDHYARAAHHARSLAKRAPHVKPARLLEGRGKRCRSDPTSSHSPVRHHTSSTNAAEQTPSRSSLGGTKKGLAWAAPVQDIDPFLPHVNYIYNWGATPPIVPNHESASMLWGYKNLAAFRKARDNYPILMGPNEFNLAAQADMSVSSVVQLWNDEIRPYGKKGKYLVSPSVTSADSGLPDMRQFFKECGPNQDGEEDNCGVNAISLHYYSNSAEDLVAYLTKWHDAFGLDIWLTEFACFNFSGGNGPCTNSQVWAFMEGVIKFAEKTPWIKMYSPFGFENDLGNVDNNDALLSNGEPTALGKYYLETTY